MSDIETIHVKITVQTSRTPYFGYKKTGEAVAEFAFIQGMEPPKIGTLLDGAIQISMSTLPDEEEDDE